jgi:hypothetical protein
METARCRAQHSNTGAMSIVSFSFTLSRTDAYLLNLEDRTRVLLNATEPQYISRHSSGQRAVRANRRHLPRQRPPAAVANPVSPLPLLAHVHPRGKPLLRRTLPCLLLPQREALLSPAVEIKSEPW